MLEGFIDTEVSLSMAGNKVSDLRHAHSSSIWIPPVHNMMKLNVKISFTDCSTTIGVGFVLRNSVGSFLNAGTTSDHAGTAKEGEYTGILVAVKWAKKQQLKNLEIETDNSM
ncbi:hypothetical protein FRX31_021974 [Thalictrum thalictroides]|uniref:RNase H type-1 domain-containing protein n=1 Tax=Thalictrum thalictroides TaxID=46969 RepID=A0A7J6VW93_THATH|nr:hypothetical protein FRX31_021974 [Thalictrum thalictroides]